MHIYTQTLLTKLENDLYAYTAKLNSIRNFHLFLFQNFFQSEILDVNLTENKIVEIR